MPTLEFDEQDFSDTQPKLTFNEDDFAPLPVKPSPYEAAELAQPGIGRAAMGPGTEFTTTLATEAPRDISEGVNKALKYGVGVPAAKLMNMLGMATAPETNIQTGKPIETPPETKAEAGVPLLKLPLAAPEEKGVIPELSRFAEGLTTPESIALLPLAPESKALQAVFGAQAALGVPDALREMSEAKTPAEQLGDFTKAQLQGGMALLMGKGLARPGEVPKSIPRERITDARQIETPATVHGDVRPLETPAEPLPVQESSPGIQPQAEPRVQEGQAQREVLLSEKPKGKTVVQAFLDQLDRPDFKGSNKFSIQAGKGITNVRELDALMNKRLSVAEDMRKLTKQAEELKDAGNTDEAFSVLAQQGINGQKAQLAREAIEFATNTGSWVEGEGSHSTYGKRPLDWRTHPEAADWLRKNGEKVGIVLPDELKSKTPEPQSAKTEPSKPPISKQEQESLLAEAGMREAEKPSEPTPATAQGEEPRVTSIKNEVVDKERTARGLPPAMEPARRSFGTVWDEAMKVVEENPKRQEELINELRDKPRALTDLEDALILHRQVDLQNQYAKEVERLNTAFDAGDQAAVHESRLRGAKLEDDLLDIYNVGKRAGTESGRGLNARKMLAAEDFSLASMVSQKRAANGGAKLNAAQSAEIARLNKVIEATQKRLDDYEKKVAEKRKAAQEPRAEDVGKAKTKTASTKAIELDPEAQRLKAKADAAKIEFKRSLVKDRLRDRPLAQKGADALVSWRRAMLLSSPVTLAKLTAAALERFAFTPIEEAAGWGIGQLPGFSKIAARAPRQGGFSVRAEAKALTDGVMKGAKDAADILKSGRGELEVFGKENLYPRDWLNFFGEIHAALKAPTKRNEFARSFQKRVEFNLRKGVDVTDPVVQTRIAQEAYRDSNRSIFMQDNRVVNAYKAAIRTLEAPGASKGAKTVAATAKYLLPIVKVPTNIVAEALQHATGLVTGSVRAANALAKGVEKLKPEEADLIMQSLKKGSLGGALIVTGFLLPEVVGGYYQPGQKRPKGDVKVGSIKVGDTQVPSYLLHNPLLEMLQLGATIRRVADSRLRKKDQDPQGLTAGAMAGALGLADEVPFIREQLQIRKLFNPNERSAFFGELAKSTVVPAAVDWVARQDDVDAAGEIIKRDPKTIMEYIRSGIPGERRTLPRKKNQ